MLAIIIRIETSKGNWLPQDTKVLKVTLNWITGVPNYNTAEFTIVLILEAQLTGACKKINKKYDVRSSYSIRAGTIIDHRTCLTILKSIQPIKSLTIDFSTVKNRSIIVHRAH